MVRARTGSLRRSKEDEGVLDAEAMRLILTGCRSLDARFDRIGFMLEQFQTLSRYNRWMNGKLYEICAAMSDAERKRDRAAPFRSIHGTFNHLLLADRIWLGRFTGQPFVARSLDQELYSDWSELRAERNLTDEKIEAWIASVSEETLMANLTFTPMSNPQEYSLPLWQCVLHLFNHQTHHRGQITTLIEQAGYDCGVTDLPIMLRGGNEAGK
jgi:uncharacterized damage-inducible protein DinB